MKPSENRVSPNYDVELFHYVCSQFMIIFQCPTMASGAGTAAEAALPVVKTEPGLPSVADRILAICGEIPDGVSDKILKVSSEWIL